MRLVDRVWTEYGRACAFAILLIGIAALLPWLSARGTAFSAGGMQFTSWLALLALAGVTLYASISDKNHLKESAARLVALQNARWHVSNQAENQETSCNHPTEEQQKLWCEQARRAAIDLAQALTNGELYLFDTPPPVEQIVGPVRQRADVPTVLRWAAPSAVMLGLIGTLYGLGSLIPSLSAALEQGSTAGVQSDALRGKLDSLREGFLLSIAGVLVSLGLSLLRATHERDLDRHFADIEAGLQRCLLQTFFAKWRPPTEQMQQAGAALYEAGTKMTSLAHTLNSLFQTIEKETRSLVAKNILETKEAIRGLTSQIPNQIEAGIRTHTDRWLDAATNHEKTFVDLLASQQSIHLKRFDEFSKKFISYESNLADRLNRIALSIDNGEKDAKRFSILLQRIAARSLSNVKKHQLSSEVLERAREDLIAKIQESTEVVGKAARTTRGLAKVSREEIIRANRVQTALHEKLEPLLTTAGELLMQLTAEEGMKGVISGLNLSQSGLESAASKLDSSSGALSQSAEKQWALATELDKLLPRLAKYVGVMEKHNALHQTNSEQMQRLLDIDGQVSEELIRTLQHYQTQAEEAAAASSPQLASDPGPPSNESPESQDSPAPPQAGHDSEPQWREPSLEGLDASTPQAVPPFEPQFREPPCARMDSSTQQAELPPEPQFREPSIESLDSPALPQTGSPSEPQFHEPSIESMESVSTLQAGPPSEPQPSEVVDDAPSLESGQEE